MISSCFFSEVRQYKFSRYFVIIEIGVYHDEINGKTKIKIRYS